MPYKSECEELLDNSIIIDEELFGTSGKRVIGPNGNSIFIPKSGGEDYSGIAYYKNECVHMWTGIVQIKKTVMPGHSYCRICKGNTYTIMIKR